MPDKNQTLEDLKQLILSGGITKKEILSLFAKDEVEKNSITKKLNIAEILYYIGGSIILLGIIILVWQNWDSFTPSLKVFITLGSTITAYLMGFLLGSDKRTSQMAPIFYFISAFLAPFGLHTLLDSQGINASTASSQSFISGVLLVLYILSFTARKRYMFVGISIVYATWFYFALTSHIIGPSHLAREYKLDEWRVIFAGTSYLALGNYFKKIEQSSFTEYLNFFGANMVLATVLFMGGWSPNQSVVWELIYPALVFGFIFGSIRFKSNSFLVLGTAYLMIYILKLTAEYFADTVGWPLALVISGFILMGVGFMSVQLRQKYTKKGAAT